MWQFSPTSPPVSPSCNERSRVIGINPAATTVTAGPVARITDLLSYCAASEVQAPYCANMYAAAFWAAVALVVSGSTTGLA